MIANRQGCGGVEELGRLGGLVAHQAEHAFINGSEGDLGIRHWLASGVVDDHAHRSGFPRAHLGTLRFDFNDEVLRATVDGQFAVADLVVGHLHGLRAVLRTANEHHGDEHIRRVFFGQGHFDHRLGRGDVRLETALHAIALDGDERAASDGGLHHDGGFLTGLEGRLRGLQIHGHTVLDGPGEFIATDDEQGQARERVLAFRVVSFQRDEVGAAALWRDRQGQRGCGASSRGLEGARGVQFLFEHDLILDRLATASGLHLDRMIALALQLDLHRHVAAKGLAFGVQGHGFDARFGPSTPEVIRRAQADHEGGTGHGELGEATNRLLIDISHFGLNANALWQGGSLCGRRRHFECAAFFIGELQLAGGIPLRFGVLLGGVRIAVLAIVRPRWRIAEVKGGEGLRDVQLWLAVGVPGDLGLAEGLAHEVVGLDWHTNAIRLHGKFCQIKFHLKGVRAVVVHAQAERTAVFV